MSAGVVMNRTPRASESSSLTSEHRQPSPELRSRFSRLLTTARGVPQEPEPLWEVQEPDQHTWSARLLYRGEWGVEAQLLRDGGLLIGYRFNTKQEAAAWASEQLAGFLERSRS